VTGHEPTPLELQAAAVVAEHLGGTEQPRDGVGAPPKTHDFDIHLPDGRCIALEVTSIAHPDVVGFHNLMGDTEWMAPALRSDWWVALPDPEGGQPVIRIKRVKRTIVDALKALETHDVALIDPDTLDPIAHLPHSLPAAVRDAIEKLRSTGVTFARCTGTAPDDVARLLFMAHGSATGNPDELNELVVERALAKQEKLVAARDAAARHLFIWLTDSYPDAELAFNTLPPPEPPPLPAGIDVVWLARKAWPIRLWRLQPPNEWES
jgi:hypothetical protein